MKSWRGPFSPTSGRQVADEKVFVQAVWDRRSSGAESEADLLEVGDIARTCPAADDKDQDKFCLTELDARVSSKIFHFCFNVLAKKVEGERMRR